MSDDGIVRHYPGAFVYSPLHPNLQQVEELRTLLDRRNIELDLEPVSRSNHFYTGENVGLYPRAFVDGRQRQVPWLGQELFGECPTVDATLTLGRDLRFVAEFFVWNEVENVETVHLRQGVWRLFDKTVILTTGKLEATYDVQRIRHGTDYAKIDGVRLSLLQDAAHLEQCDFVLQEMDPW